MERLFKSGIITTLIGLIILFVALYLYVSLKHSETEAGAVAALGILLLRSKDSLIGIGKSNK
jgi:hypothetical protein